MVRINQIQYLDKMKQCSTAAEVGEPVIPIAVKGNTALKPAG